MSKHLDQSYEFKTMIRISVQASLLVVTNIGPMFLVALHEDIYFMFTTQHTKGNPNPRHY